MTIEFSANTHAPGPRLFCTMFPGSPYITTLTACPIGSDTPDNKIATTGIITFQDRPEDPIQLNEITCRYSGNVTGTGISRIEIRLMDGSLPDETDDGLLGYYSGPMPEGTIIATHQLTEHVAGRLLITHSERICVLFKMETAGEDSITTPYLMYNSALQSSTQYTAYYVNSSWTISLNYLPNIILHGVDNRAAYINDDLPFFNYSNVTFNKNSAVNTFGMSYIPDRDVEINGISLGTSFSSSTYGDFELAAYRSDGTKITSIPVKAAHIGAPSLNCIYYYVCEPFTVAAYEKIYLTVEATSDNSIQIYILNYYSVSSTEYVNEYIKNVMYYNNAQYSANCQYVYRYSDGTWVNDRIEAEGTQYETKRRINIAPHILSYGDVPEPLVGMIGGIGFK